MHAMQVCPNLGDTLLEPQSYMYSHLGDELLEHGGLERLLLELEGEGGVGERLVRYVVQRA